MADWATISALATAGGTLVLAGATFASVRSANRAARAAERSMLASLRPLLIQSRTDDAPQKVGFADAHWMVVEPGGGTAEVTDEAVYLAISLRNAGSGIAVLHGWYLYPRAEAGINEHAPLEQFVRLTRDLYIASGDLGFWQGSFRDPSSDGYAAARAVIEERVPMMIEILYGDYEGGQRAVTRFGLMPRSDGDGWIAGAGRHWQIDRDDPR